MRKGRNEMKLTDARRRELHDLYESSLVHARPLKSGNDNWQELMSLVLARGHGGVVITAWNPGEARPDRMINERANAKLLRDLLKTSYEIWEADGFSLDGSFRERGFLAWGMDQKTGCDLARNFGQYAIFFYKADGTREVVGI